MILKLFKNKKFLLAAVLIAGLFFVFSTKSANACNPFTDGTACIEELVTTFVQTITLMIFTFLGKAINIIANYLFPIVSLGNQAIGSPLVKQGFKICLQIANLGFVVSIIYVAFATITKFNDYTIKEFLTHLVFAAVLINFSFAMAGTIMDVSNVVGNYFLAKSIPDGKLEGFSEQMANAFNLGRVAQVKPDTNVGLEDNLSSVGRTFLNVIFSMGISIFVSIIILLTFIGIAGMMLARYVAMVILLTCMPVIWLAYMSPFPQVKSYFSKWWGYFLQWIYFYPITAFFLYLALLTATTTTAGLSNSVDATNAAQETTRNILNEFGLTGIIDAVVKAAFFMVALYMGSKAGGGFMTTTFNWAKGAKNKMIGAYKGAGIAATKPLTYVPARLLKNYAKGENATGFAGRLNRFASFIPGIGSLNKAITTGIQKGQEAGIIAKGSTAQEIFRTGKEGLKDAKNRISKMDDDELIDKIASNSFTGKEKMAAMLKLQEKDKIDKTDIVSYLAQAGIEKEWEEAGVGRELGKIQKKMGVNTEMAQMAKAGDADGFEKARKGYHGSLKEADVKSLHDDAVAQEFNPEKSKLHKSLDEEMFNRFRNGLASTSIKNNPGAYVARIMRDLPNAQKVNEFKIKLLKVSKLRPEIKNLPSDKKELEKVKSLIKLSGLITDFKENDHMDLDEDNNVYLKNPLSREDMIREYETLNKVEDPTDAQKKKMKAIDALMAHFLEEDDTNMYKAFNSGLNRRITIGVDDLDDSSQKPPLQAPTPPPPAGAKTP